MSAIRLSLNSQARRVLSKLRSSQFARDAVLLLIVNTVSKAAGFFGMAYAARCLGPVNLGISAVVQTTAQQVALIYNGGFDTVAVRKIAADHKSCPPVTEAITFFRLCLALSASVGWVVFCYVAIPNEQRVAWLMGVPVMLISASNITFAFQGLERLPIQNGIGASSVLLSAAAYFVFFSPGMFLGADLIVVSAAGLFTVVVSWLAYFRIFRQWPIAKTGWRQVLSLLRESWRYWVLAVVVYFYSIFQIPLVAYLRGPREAGIFRSAYQMALGVWLLFNSINSLLLPRLVAWKQLGVGVMWRKQSRLLLVYPLLGVPPVAAIILVAPIVYRVLLGPDFIEGVLVFRILVAQMLVVFVGQIYAWGLTATGGDTQFLLATLLGALSNVTLNLLFTPIYGIVMTACISLLSDILVHSYCYIALRVKITKGLAA